MRNQFEESAIQPKGPEEIERKTASDSIYEKEEAAHAAFQEADRKLRGMMDEARKALSATCCDPLESEKAMGHYGSLVRAAKNEADEAFARWAGEINGIYEQEGL